MLDVLLFLVGVIVGLLITWIMYRLKTTHGILKIDTSNIEQDIYRICIDDLDNLSKKKRVVLKVDPNATLSQE